MGVVTLLSFFFVACHPLGEIGNTDTSYCAFSKDSDGVCQWKDHTPVALDLTPISIKRDNEVLITLNYIDFDSDLATSCTLSNLSELTETIDCSCDEFGICTVGVTGASIGLASFDYTVTAAEAVSNSAHVNFIPFSSTWTVGDAAYGDGDKSITLPLVIGFTYDFSVDWGDGSSDIITAWNQAEKTHVYADAGNYTVTLSGVAQSWKFANAGDKDKITSVVNFGNMGWTSLVSAFYGCSKMTSFSGGATDTVTSMALMFYNAQALTSLDLSSFDTSSVTNM